MISVDLCLIVAGRRRERGDYRQKVRHNEQGCNKKNTGERHVSVSLSRGFNVCLCAVWSRYTFRISNQ